MLTVNVQELKDAVKHLKRVKTSKVDRVYRFARIDGDTISVTNLDVWKSYTLESAVYDDGGPIFVELSTLAGVLKTLPKTEKIIGIEATTDGHVDTTTLYLSDGNIELQTDPEETDEFCCGGLTGEKVYTADLPYPAVAAALKNALNFVAPERDWYALNMIYIDIKAGRMSICGADGNRMYVGRVAVGAPDFEVLLMPDQVRNILGVKAERLGVVESRTGEKNKIREILLIAGPVRVCAQAADGQYPDYEKIMLERAPESEVDLTSDILPTIQRAAVLNKETDSYGTPMACVVLKSNGKVTLHLEDPEMAFPTPCVGRGKDFLRRLSIPFFWDAMRLGDSTLRVWDSLRRAVEFHRQNESLWLMPIATDDEADAEATTE